MDTELKGAANTNGFKEKWVGKFALVPQSRRSAGHMGSYNAMQACDIHAITEVMDEASTCVYDFWKLIAHLQPSLAGTRPSTI